MYERIFFFYMELVLGRFPVCPEELWEFYRKILRKFLEN